MRACVSARARGRAGKAAMGEGNNYYRTHAASEADEHSRKKFNATHTVSRTPVHQRPEV